MEMREGRLVTRVRLEGLRTLELGVSQGSRRAGSRVERLRCEPELTRA